MSTLSQIQRIEEKLKVKLNLLGKLQKENEARQKQIEKLLAKNSEYEEQVRLLREENLILKAATGTMTPDEKIKLEKSINKYIREIDNCIGILNR